MKHTTSRMLFSYWNTLRGDRPAPERGDIDPGQIRHVLANTFILELGPDHDADIRLAGTRLCALFGRELKGEAFDSLWVASSRSEIQRCIDVVVEESTGIVAGIVGIAQESRTIPLEMILLPLRRHGKADSRILGALAPAALPSWIGMHRVSRLDVISVRVISPNRREIASFGGGDRSRETARPLVVHKGGPVAQD
jgi:hypothetical protein